MEFTLFVPSKPGEYVMHRTVDRLPVLTTEGGVVVQEGLPMEDIQFDNIIVGKLVNAAHILVMYNRSYRWCFYDRRTRAVLDRFPKGVSRNINYPVKPGESVTPEISGTVGRFMEAAEGILEAGFASGYDNGRFPNKELVFTAETESLDSLAMLLKRLPDENRDRLENHNGTWVLHMRHPGRAMLDRLRGIPAVEFWKDDVLVVPKESMPSGR